MLPPGQPGGKVPALTEVRSPTYDIDEQRFDEVVGQVVEGDPDPEVHRVDRDFPGP